MMTMQRGSTGRTTFNVAPLLRVAASRRAAQSTAPSTEALAAWTREIHDDVTAFFQQLDGGAFREDRWERPGGGGGVSRVLEDGACWEKAGVNWSAVDGEVPPEMSQHLCRLTSAAEATHFFATGVSVVVHPRSPLVPTVHLNVRAFVLADENGKPLDHWYGGGTDLTPTYPFPEDAVHFHTALRDLCNRHDAAYYPKFKSWCDRYFVNTHRGEESRGIGGIFFDHLRPGGGRSAADVARFVADVGRSLPEIYGPIVLRRRGLEYGERERALQLHRRGRYVEFNLVHDRGTRFGLQTNARMESVLMSLPPMAAWAYAPAYAPGSIESELLEMLKAREWATPSSTQPRSNGKRRTRPGGAMLGSAAPPA
jgi:coproporphyrinogen III oxidase